MDDKHHRRSRPWAFRWLALVPGLGLACNLLLDNEVGYWVGTGPGGAAGFGGLGGAHGSMGAAAGVAGETSCPEPCAPEDLPTDGLELWFAADRGVVTEEGAVSYWADQSGRANHAAQAVASQRPILASSPSGLPMLDFDGAGDHLRLPIGFSSFDGASFFLVARADPNTGCAGILSFANGNYTDDVEFGRHTPNLLYFEVLGDAVEGADGGFEAGRLLQASILQRADTTVELRLAGTITGSGTAELPAEVTRQQNFIGKNTYTECPTTFDGRIGEILLYTRGLTPAERESVERYLELKWDL